ncbi:MAG TPA: DHH family phosphoesterase [Opitutaceae bacterium]|nr:DHH family phosphoesterase [Opitutaceae bacterium]
MEKFYPSLADGFGRLLASLPGRPVAVIGHARPDGDCIGSQVALARILAARGIEAICANPDPVPRRLQFLTPGLSFLRTDALLARAAGAVAVFVDCADHARAGERLQALFPAPAGNIDHHLSNAGYAAVNLIDSGSAATCEILAGLAFDFGLPVDARTAQALYTGILTDTGQFRFASTSRRCFALAGELVARGADPAVAGFELYEQESAGRLKLLEHFLGSLRLEAGGRICLGTLPAGIFEKTGTTAEDTEGLVDYARSIAGVDIGVLIEERADGTLKASLRAKDPACRVDLVAAEFGGGGHACAAGLNLKSVQKDFLPRLIAALTQRLPPAR